MILVNATGSDTMRFNMIDAALQDLIYGTDDEHGVFINLSAGDSLAFSHITGRLHSMSIKAKYHFPVTVIRLPHCTSAEDVREVALKNGGIVVVDEAQHIDRIDGAAEALRALESPHIKIVYVGISTNG